MQEMTEAQFLAKVKSIASIYGWELHHSTPMLTKQGKWLTSGSAGFPDLVLAHRTRGLIFAELKTRKGKTSPEQANWILRLQPHAECYVWRPDNFDAIIKRLAA